VTGPDRLRQVHVALRDGCSTINSVHKRIITVEEPVEYEMKGINQIAVRPEIGLTFAMGLRHILRQDPERDHGRRNPRPGDGGDRHPRRADRPPGVQHAAHERRAQRVHALIDMGIEPFLVASSVEAIMAQRLVRTICPHCKTGAEGGAELPARIGFPEEEIETAKFWHGAGCEECRQLGYQGRLGIYELLMV
jgi:general secretion pathway protein E